MSPHPPFTLAVQLKQGDFLYYTWVLALKRPVLLFFIYTFVLLFLLSVTGIYPPARVYSLALLLPLVGYLIWVYLSALLLWSRFPALRAPRHYTFKESSFLLQTEDAASKKPIPYSEITRLLLSRRALYLLRQDGTAEILPREALPVGLEDFLNARLESERSSFL